MKTFLFDNNLETLWNKFDCDYTYSFSKLVNGLDRSYFSVLDHFCVNSNFLDSCIEASPLFSPDNLSNHLPILLKYKCSSNDVPPNVNPIHDRPVINKPAWGRASHDNLTMYVSHLESLLVNINIPNSVLHCTDLHCNNPQHKSDIDFFSLQIMDSISTAVEANIPSSCKSGSFKHTPVPGWTEFVKPFRDDSLFWHSVWVSAGRPLNTVLHQVMRSTRHKYHYAIRKVRNVEKEIRKDKMLQDSLNGKVNDILKHIKSLRKTNKGYVNNIDGVRGSEEIASHFSDIYKDIYNRHQTTDSVNNILDEVNNNIDETSLPELDRITCDLISGIIKNLGTGKNDELYSWGTDAIKHGIDCIVPYFKILFKTFLVHGHISHPFLCCALLPIVKSSKKSKFSADNYRLIAISSLILKILDHIILILNKDNLSSNNLQFGFEKKCSASMCSWMMLETVNYFTNRDSPVYLCLLDLTKAFDLVKHNLLFDKLKNRVHPLYLRLVIYSYLHQSVYVRWDGHKSQSFRVLNGVRQGAVASPIFFNTYIDELFDILKKSGFGCMINDLYYGLIGFADDCALIAPSRQALQKMLFLCVVYFNKHGIIISVDENIDKSKTKCIAFNINIVPDNIMLYNKPLPWVDFHVHLGHLIHKDETMDHDIFIKRAEFITKIHSLTQELGSQHPSVLIKLVRIYYCSFFGSNLWDLYSLPANRLFTTWNVSIRQFYNLPYATHRHILQDLIEVPHLRTALLCRFIKFYTCLRDCTKIEVRNLFEIQRSDMRSIFGRNCFNLCREFNVINIGCMAKNDIVMPIKTPVQESWRLNFLLDLLSVRSSSGDHDFTGAEIDDLIEYICCN